MRAPYSRTLGDLIDEMADRHHDHIAVVHRLGELSYGELALQSQSLSDQLAAWGIGRGDTVALLACNRPFWIVTAVATARLGALLAPFNTWSKSWDIDFLLEHSQPRILIAMDRFLKHDYLSLLKELIPEAWEATPGRWRSKGYPSLEYLVIQGESCPPGAVSFPETMSGGAGISSIQRPPGEGASAQDDLYLLYTSGSTARPKGVLLKHYGCIENGFNIGERLGLQVADRVWFSLPLFWSYGCANALMTTFTHGATLVIEDTFIAQEAIETIERERCTHIYVLPNIIHAIAEHPKFTSERFAALRGGATIGKPEDIRLAAEVLGAREICNIYGSTETYGNCVVSWHSDSLDIRMASQGRALPGNELRIVSTETGESVTLGEVGEIQVRGYVTEGYFKADSLNADSFTQDGFFRTGDIGSIDNSGWFHFCAREQEMIKTGGINVSPIEVEEFLSTHPAVKDVIVVGVPHPVKGELIFAFVRCKGSRNVDEQGLKGYAEERIAKFKIPHIIVFTEEFPKTDTGKISRRLLREMASTELQRRGIDGK
jgi:fatty-acyl-CoA synthase